MPGLFQRSALIPLFMGITVLICGCVTLSDPEAAQEYTGDIIGIVRDDQTVGQTFISRRPHLNSITLWLSVEPSSGNQKTSNAVLDIQLYHTPTDTWPIYSTQISFNQIINNTLQIAISPQPDPPEQSYYLVLRSERGSLRVNGRAEDAYPDGEAFLGSEPIQADMAFRLTYDYDPYAVIDDIKRGLSNTWLILPLGMVLLIPGWLVLDLSGLQHHYNRGEQIGISLGLSLAIIPLVMLWTSYLGLAWNRTAVFFGSGVLTAIVLVRFLSRYYIIICKKKQPSNGIQNDLGINPGKTPWTALIMQLVRKATLTLILLAVFVLSLAIRLVMVRDMSAPAWVDSVHHAVITRLIVESGGIPQTYAPFINIDANYYHPGFHSVLAVFYWLSGLDIPQAMLLLGQVLNAFAVITAFTLTTALVNNRIAGIIAALVTGLFTPMPAYYTSWSRYTQLTGLLILPVAFLMTKWLLEKDHNRRELVTALLISAVASAGLFMVHYRVAAFLICLILAYIISQVRFKRLELWQLVKKGVGYVGIYGLAACILTLPWIWPTFTRVFIPIATSSAGKTTTAFSDFSWRYLTTASGQPAMVLAGFGLVWGTIKRQRFVITLVLWTFLLFFLANLGALSLPGGSFINNTSVEITLFLPISILAGFFLAQVIHLISIFPTIWQNILRIGLVLGGIILAYVGARKLLPILNPTTDLFRSADRPVMSWIQEHIPANEEIMINPFYWGYNLYAGSDGGFWISPLAGRKTIPPPVLYGVGPADEIQRITSTCQAVMNQGKDAQALWSTLHSQAIHYIYIGARGGVVSPQALRNSLLFKTLYSQNGAWLFEVLPKP